MLISQRPVLTEEYIDSARSRFVIEPLEPGFGYTLGNSLRRTLLSSIPGAAVTSVKIDGILHEFTTINGVKEDVSEIILNIKGLVLSSDSDEPVVMYLSKEGPGEVTAGDIQPPAGVEIHNPDMHIASLNEQARLDIEFIVERGRGYVPAATTAGGGDIGRIPVDQIYSPVLKVTYKVEATRVEQRTDFDKLIIDVREKSQKMIWFEEAQDGLIDAVVPAWLQVVPSTLRILVHQLPERAQIDVPLQEQLIVELYSK